MCDDYQFMIHASYVCGCSMYNHISRRLRKQRSLVRLILSFDVGFYKCIPYEIRNEYEFRPYYKKWNDKCNKVDWKKLSNAIYLKPDEPHCDKIIWLKHSIKGKSNNKYGLSVNYNLLELFNITKKRKNINYTKKQNYVATGYKKIPKYGKFLKILMKNSIGILIKDKDNLSKFSKKVRNMFNNDHIS